MEYDVSPPPSDYQQQQDEDPLAVTTGSEDALSSSFETDDQKDPPPPTATIIVPSDDPPIVVPAAESPPPRRHTHHLRTKPTKATTRSATASGSKQSGGASSSSSPKTAGETQASTMREVLASIPGFSIKPRRRGAKKMSTAAQIAQTREGCIDLETPDSILVGTNLRALLNKATFSILPPLYQHKLIQLLPSVDRPTVDPETMNIRLSSTSLTNEFFARACVEWQERLAEGEFTPENQQKLKSEAEKEKSKLDPWKLKHFEPLWGDKQPQPVITVAPSASTTPAATMNKTETVPPVKEEVLESRPALKTTIKLRPTTSIASSSTAMLPTIKSSPHKQQQQQSVSPVTSPKRVRTVGAVTRASAAANATTASPPPPVKSPNPMPDLLPIRTAKRCLPVPADSSSSTDEPESILPDTPPPATLKEDKPNVKRSAEDSPSSVDAPASKVPRSNEDEDTESIVLVEELSRDDDEPRRPPDEDFSESSGEQLEHLSETDLFYKDARDGDGGVVGGEETSSQSNTTAESQTPSDAAFQTFQIVSEDNQIEIVSCDNLDEIIAADTPTTVAAADQQQQQQQTATTTVVVATTPEAAVRAMEDACDGATTAGGGGSVGMDDCGEDSTGDAEELMPSIQNMQSLPLDDPDQIDEHLTDAVNYVLESGEITAEETVMSHEEKMESVFGAVKSYETHHVVTSEAEIHYQESPPMPKQEFVMPSEWSSYEPKPAENAYLEEAPPILLAPSHHHHQQQQQQPQQLQQQQQQVDEDEQEEELSQEQIIDEISFDPSEPSQESKEEKFHIKDEDELELNSQPAEMEVSSTVISSMAAFAGLSGVCLPVVSSAAMSQHQQHHHHHHQLAALPHGSLQLPPKTILRPPPPVPPPPLPSHPHQHQQHHQIISQQNFLIQQQQQPPQTPVIAALPPPTSSLATTTPIVGHAHHPVLASSAVKLPTSAKQIIYTTAGAPGVLYKAPLAAPPAVVKATLQQQAPAQPPPPPIIMTQQRPRFPAAMPAGLGLGVARFAQPAAAGAATSVSHHQGRRKTEGKGRGGRSSSANNRPPPGAVNLERSYQICQAVIQNSPNRHQLKAQLRPPQEFLAAAAAGSNTSSSSSNTSTASIAASATNNSSSTATTMTTPASTVVATISSGAATTTKNGAAVVASKTLGGTIVEQTQYGNVSSSNKISAAAAAAAGRVSAAVSKAQKTVFVQRQQSPNLIVRQVYSSSAQPGTAQTVAVATAPRISVASATGEIQQALVNNGNGQYVLLQRTGIIQQDNGQQRASSAPPAQNQLQGINGIPLTITGRAGRPASVDMAEATAEVHTLGPNPGVQAVTRRGPNQGIPYSDANTDPTTLQNYVVTGGDNGNQSTTNCHCSLNAMVICQKCGAFTHEDCQKQKLCVSCVIR